MGPQQARLSVLACSHPACLTHDPGPAHPEHPERLRAVVEALRSAFGERLTWVVAPRATREQLLRAHTGRLVDELERALPASRIHRLDADTSMSPDSLEASLRACGAVCARVDAVLAGPDRRGFCAVRPPGHHSNAGRASGFCLYNQIAVGARHALAVHRLGRVAVVGEPLCGTPAYAYSTVTLLARLRGWSTSVPLSTAT